MLAAALVAGCGPKTFRTETKQPQLKLGKTQLERTSVPLFIVRGNMNLPRFVFLPNTAYFTWISRDRIRFHVTLHHNWEDLSDPSRWRVWLEDEFGNRYYPVDLDRKNIRPVTKRFDFCPVRGSLNNANRMDCTLATQGDALNLVTVFRGDGDYVFYGEDLFQEDRARMELVMQRPGVEFRYRWDFTEKARDPSPSLAVR